MRAHRHQPALTHAGIECVICKASCDTMLAAERYAVDQLATALHGILASGEVTEAHATQAKHALRVAAGKVRR